MERVSVLLAGHRLTPSRRIPRLCSAICREPIWFSVAHTKEKKTWSEAFSSPR
jgi:hypothetical protein